MSKTINLNENVRVKLTETGLNEYLKQYNWKSRQDIIDNGMWLKEQFWVVMECFSKFGQSMECSFTQIIFEDSLLEDCKVEHENTEIEKLAILAFDTWLGKHYTKSINRRKGLNPKRPDYITVGVDIVTVMEYKPSDIPGRYHIAMAYGVNYPQPDKKTRTLKQIKNLLLRNVATHQTRYERSGHKIASDIIDWCDGRNYTQESFDALQQRTQAWGRKAGAKEIRKAMKTATDMWASIQRRRNALQA